MAKVWPNIEIVALLYGMADRAKAMAVTENILTAYRDIDGLYADNESSTAGAVQALKSRGDRRTKLVAMDASDQILADMKDGWIDSLVVQDPFKMGYESVKAIGEARAGRQPAAIVDSGVALVKREEMDKPEFQVLLYPDIKRWLEAR